MKAISIEQGLRKNAVYGDDRRPVQAPPSVPNAEPSSGERQMAALVEIAAKLADMAKQPARDDVNVLAEALRELAQQTAAIGKMLVAQQVALQGLSRPMFEGLHFTVTKRDGSGRITAAELARET